MRLDNPNVIDLTPEWMRTQSDTKAIAGAIDDVISILSARAKLLTRWDKLDQLTDDELNDIAWELNIPWYEQESKKSVKVSIIKNSDLVNAKLGTKWAVESVLGDYFQSCVMREWYQYGGKPYHFQILSANPDMANGKLEQFERLLKVTKKRSAWLDTLCICLTGDTPVYAGCAQEDFSKERHAIGRNSIDMYTDCVYHFYDKERCALGRMLTIEEREALERGEEI